MKFQLIMTSTVGFRQKDSSGYKKLKDVKKADNVGSNVKCNCT